MTIVFNKCIFAYLCLFYSSTKYFHKFQSIFINFRFTNIFVKIFTDIFDISVKSKYRYIRNYRYFVPWLQVKRVPFRMVIGRSLGGGGIGAGDGGGGIGAGDDGGIEDESTRGLVGGRGRRV